MSIDAKSPYLKRVWKVASRWSDDGNAGSSVLELFRDHKIVFVGRAQEKFTKVEVGDLLVISDGFHWQHNVIDGQQRLTTLLLLLRALELRGAGRSCGIDGNYTKRLFTKVGAGVQQAYLGEALSWNPQDDAPVSELNIYYHNLAIIFELLDSMPELSVAGSRSAFVDYLVSKVYFVVIETRAGLSKTLQIFKAINTTGMDLNGGDVFKIRFYEYLRHLGHHETVFDEVAKLYDEIDARNDKAARPVARMESILSVARHYVATEAELANSVRLFNGTTFFERFFDVVINNERRDGFARDKCESFKLSLELIRELIDVRFRWDEPESQPFGGEARIMDQLIWWGRYDSYYEILFLFCHRFSPTPVEIEHFTIAYSKLLSAYSLIFERITAARKNFLHELLKRFASKSEETADSIVRHIDDLRAARRDDVLWAMENHQLAGLWTKNLACRLVAMLDEPSFPDGSANDLHALLFDTQIDIEHIEACNHKNLTERERIQNEWGGDLHSLGNLTVLERSLNRGEVSNHDYATVKRGIYRQSKFATVRGFATTHDDWTLKKAQKRKQILADRIATYLCGPKAATTPEPHP